MGSFSDYLENKFILHFTNLQAYPQPALFLALCKSSPSESSTGFGLPEIDHAYGYERVPLNQGTNHWAVLSNRTAQNLVSIIGNQAEEDWQAITHWALVDSGDYRKGNMLAYGEFTTPTTVRKDKRFHIDPYKITVQFTNPGISDYAALKFLNHLFGLSEYIAPNILYLGIGLENTVDPNIGVVEPDSATTYARQTLNNWFPAVGDTTYSDDTYIYTATGIGWGVVKYFAIFEDVIGDNLLFYKELNNPFMFLGGSTITIVPKTILLIAS